MKILLVEDCHNVAQVIFDFFEDSAFELDYAATGTSGSSLAKANRYDCIVLDVMLPGLDGISLCQQLRAAGDNTPIIMLTARDTNNDMLLGLRQGADDYIVKPFNLELLEARINSLLRRNTGVGFVNQLNYGPITIDIDKHQVCRDGQAIKLTPAGFKILMLLVKNAPQLTSRQQLEALLWPDETPDQDVLRKHIYQLRHKIDKPFDQNIIETIPKLGYKLVNPNE